jgi:DNA-binding response OmpR family regulator
MSSELLKPLRILSVEDNRAETPLLQAAFDDSCYYCELTLCGSPMEAEVILISQQFDLLLSDFGGDEQEGMRFVRSVRSKHPLLPVLVLSGIFNPRAAYEAGAHAFIRKSNDWPELVRTVRGLLHFWTEVAELAT